MRKLKAASLVLDFALYPRMEVESQHVTYIAQAIKAGANMPPVVICKKTKRVVDGFHRIRATLRVGGKDASIDVLEKEYRSDRALFLDAMRYNATHGRTLSTYDRTHCVLTAKELGIEVEEVAGVLHVEPAKLENLRVARSATADDLHVPIKQTIKHMAGRKLSKKQYEANRKLGGMNQRFYVNQIIMLIENGLLDMDQNDLLVKLKHLGQLIGKNKSIREAAA